MGQLYEQQPSPSVPLPDDRLGRALGTNKPIVSPPLPTGPKPATPAFPTPEQLTTDPSLISKFGAAKTTDLPALQQEQLDLAGRSAQAEKESTVLTGENTARQEKARTQLLQESQQRDKALKEEHQKGLQEVSPFAPTKETATDLAGLFSLLTVATMGSGGAGRYKGMATLASLTGAMKGYNEGRKELFNKDIKNFEENLKSIQSHNDKINKLYQDGMDSLSKNQELGEQKIKEAAALDNNGVIKKLADMHMYDKMGVAINTVIKALQQAQDKIDARKLEFEKISAQFSNQKKLREEEAKNKPPELYRAADGKTYVWDRAKQQFAPAENAPAGLAKAGTRSKTAAAADDVVSYLSDKGIQIADKKDRAAVQSAVNAMANLQSLKNQISTDKDLVGRQGQIRQFTDRYIESFKNGGAEPTGSVEDQAALRFAKKYASMLTRYEQALAGSSRSGSTVAFQKRYNDLLSQNQFNAAGMNALLDDMSVEVARGAREKSPKITIGLMEQMASDFESGMGDTPVTPTSPVAAAPSLPSGWTVKEH